jgi:subtilisin family serine protease
MDEKKYFGSALRIRALLFITVLLLLSMPSATFAVWSIEAVDVPKRFSDFYSRAIAIDRVTNKPHIVYGGNQLYHAYFNGTQWIRETIDSALGAGRYASIAIDLNNKIHISYYDSTNGDLKYATNTSGVWVKSTIDGIGDVGQYSSIAIDTNNKIHISYYDSANGALKYATNSTGSWVISFIDSSGDVGEYTSIAVDSNNKIHISYYDSTNGDLKYATNTSGVWIKSTINGIGDVGQYSSIAIDTNNKIHISYCDSTNLDLKYATNASGSWVTSTIDSSGNAGYYTSIAIDSDNKVHISYTYLSNWDLKYATNASGSWVTSTIDSSGAMGKYTSIALDTNNKLHISYFDDTNGYLRYATNTSDSWVTSTVDSETGNIDFYTSIAVDSNNKIHISYYDSTNQDLKYATYGSGSWVTSTIDSTGNVGQYNSITADSNNKIHFSYYDSTNQDLKYATNASGSWVTSAIDSNGNVGQYNSITLDSNNKIHISYLYQDLWNLKYATNASGSWVTSTIDSSIAVGPYTSIALDSNNKAHISYFDYNQFDLKYATNASGSWVTSTIDSTGNTGYYTSIALDSNNKAHISYYDSTNRDLKYATNASGSWVTLTIDSAGDVGWYTSIAVDSNNKAHISYYDGSNYDLKYATNASGVWIKSTIDSAGYVGQYTSIAIDSNNYAHVSYPDLTYGVLKYATNSPYSQGVDITVSPVSFNFGNIFVGASSEQDITVFNSGTEDLIIGNIAQSNPAAAPFSIVSDNCSGSTFAPGAACTLRVRFSPVTSGSFTDTFDIPSNDPDENPVTVSLSGTGIASNPDITVSSVSVGFGSIAVGSYSDRNITVQNDGTANLIIGNIAQSNPAAAPFSIVSDNCSGSTFAPGAACTLTVRFEPGTIGTFTDTFDIPSNDPDENPVTVSLNGTTPVPNITVMPDSVDFGSVYLGSLRDIMLTLVNNGTTYLIIGNIAQAYHLTAPFSIVTDNCSGLTFAPGESCTLTVRFAPISSGSFSDSFDITSNDPDEDLVMVNLSGLGKITLSSKWKSETVDSAGIVGQYTSIAIDSNDKVHISYYDASNSDLKYATNISGSWVKSTLDSTGIVGKYSSIALNSSDNVNISYYEEILNEDWGNNIYSGNLKFATNSSGSWIYNTIEYGTLDLDNNTDVGRYSSIAIDSLDKVHISYMANVFRDLSCAPYYINCSYLSYATNASGSWAKGGIVKVGATNGGFFNPSSDIAVDLTDKVHISYGKLGSGLMHATNTSGTWIMETVDGLGTGQYSSLAVDSTNKLHIGYATGDLQYATNASGSWATSTIDSLGYVGIDTSIAIDSLNKAHISYYDDTNGDLKYATTSSGTWIAETLDNNGNVGRYTSIAIDSNDKVHISYYDATNGDLKYATNAVTVTGPEITVSPVAVNFDVKIAGSLSDQIITILNDGTENLTVGSIAQSNPAAAPFSIVTDNCSGLTFVPGESCTLTVRFAPTAAGSFSDSFDIPSDDPDENPVTVTLIGTAINPDEDFETGDFSKFPWITGGDGVWTVQQGVRHKGYYAAEAQVSIGDNQSSYLEVTLNIITAGDISFWFKVSSENGYDGLIFSIDNVLKGSWSGEVNWSSASYAVSAGVHTFRWTYVKNSSVSSGNDTAWIDNISFPPYELTYSLSGRVTNAGVAFNGITVNLTGTLSKTAVTDNNGDYRFIGIPDGTYTMTPNVSGYTFTPASRNVTMSGADITGLNFAVVPPDIGATPTGFDLTVLQGNTVSDTMTITNSGAGSLTYRIRTEEASESGSPAKNTGSATSDGYMKMLSFDKTGKRTYKIPEGVEYSDKRILVKFKQGTSDVEKKNLHKKAGGTVEKKFKKIKVERVKISNKKIIDAINEYLKDDGVEYAEPDYIVRTSLTPNDPGFGQLWGLHNTGQSGGASDADIDAPEAWDVTTGGNVVVAVIDTGVNYNHEDLSTNMWVNTGEIPGNGIDDDGNGYIDDYRGWDFYSNDNNPMDDSGHGTHCSGTIAGIGNNGIGIAGINWTAKIMPLKFLGADGSGYSSDAVEAVLYAKDMGARISSNSWGGGEYSQSLYDAIRAFGDAGGLFVASAGNSSQDTDILPHYPASFDLSSIIAVTATDSTDALASFSNYGATSVDLAAPGVAIYSTLPQYAYLSSSCNDNDGDGYGYCSGTSMATPHVAGVASLVLSHNSNLTAVEVKNAIMNGIDPLVSLNGKMVTGGRLNAEKALKTSHWLSLSLISGVIASGRAQDITVTADAASLAGGLYNANIIISSNDLDENPVIIPLNLTVIPDNDRDGYPPDVDCDDNDPLEHPGQTWYLDADNDGYSDGTVNTTSCERPLGYKAASELTDITGDCDDGNPVFNPETYWYPDLDGDSFGNPLILLQQCTQPEGFVLDNSDYDDSDPYIYLGGPPVRTTGASTSYHLTLQEAYDAANDGDTIQCQATSFTEDLYIDLNKTITIRGGYNNAYTTVIGRTTLNGLLEITDGAVAIWELLLQ